MPTQAEKRAKRKTTGILTKARSRAADRSSASRCETATIIELTETEIAIDANQVAAALRMTDGQVAKMAGLEIRRTNRRAHWATFEAPTRLREIVDILSRVQQEAGGQLQALAWYRAEPIPALGGRTAEALVKAGESGAVLHYLDHLKTGGFA